jgi:tetratricopeptide (TPR) repeat protein
MLDTLTIVCPKCQKRTEISIARKKAGERTVATTACRRCRGRFIALTQADGTVILVDGDPAHNAAEASGPRILDIIRPATGRSGYRVEAPAHLGIFDRGVPPPTPAPGISDEDLHNKVVSLGEEIFRRPDGSPRSPSEAAKSMGWRGVWVAQLNAALKRRLAAPPPLSFPPGIFISYRWGTADENDWVARLARTLKARGYPVTFDRDEPKDLDVPELVSKIADCRYFLAILDNGYVERLGTPGNDRIKDGWVWDEYNAAAHLSNVGQLRIVGLLRADIDMPTGFGLPTPGTPGNVIDVRRSETLDVVLDDVFPAIEDAPPEETTAEARQLLARSHELLCASELQVAFEAAEKLTNLLPGVIDGPAQKVRVALRAGSPEAGLAAAEQALELAPRSHELLRAAGMFASAAGEHKRAAAYLGTYLEEGGEEESANVVQAHAALGSSLDDLGQVHAAIAHLEIARAAVPQDPNLLNALGYVYRRAGDTTSALQRFEQGLSTDPSNSQLLLNAAAALIEAGQYPDAALMLDRLESVAPGSPEIAGLRRIIASASAAVGPPSLVAVVSRDATRRVTCKACHASLPIGDSETLCARCGSVVSLSAAPCPNCTSTGRVVLLPGLAQLCPYCRKGSISIV